MTTSHSDWEHQLGPPLGPDDPPLKCVGSVCSALERTWCLEVEIKAAKISLFHANLRVPPLAMPRFPPGNKVLIWGLIRGWMVVKNLFDNKASFLGVGVALGGGTIRFPRLFFRPKIFIPKPEVLTIGKSDVNLFFWKESNERKTTDDFHPRAPAAALPQQFWLQHQQKVIEHYQDHHNWNLPKITI